MAPSNLNLYMKQHYTYWRNLSLKRHEIADPRLYDFWFSGLLFLAIFVYLWQGVGTHLLYYGFGVFADYPVFSWSSSFFQTSFSAPGKPLQALGAWLANGFYSAWLGALIIVLVLAWVFLGIRCLLQSIRAGRFRDLAWGPPVIALVLCNRYENPLNALLGIGTSVWLVLLYGRISLRSLCARAVIFSICFSLLYSLNAGSAFIFASITILVEVFLQGKKIEALLHALLALGSAFVLGRLVFLLEAQTVYLLGTPWNPAVRPDHSALSNLLLSAMFVYVPALVLVTLLFSSLLSLYLRPWFERRKRRPKRAQARKRVARSARPQPTYSPRLWDALRVVLVGGTVLLCVAFSRSYLRYERLLHYHAFHRNWHEVLRIAESMRGRIAFTRPGIFDINRASAHLGVLGDTFCAYPQDKSAMLFLNYPEARRDFQYAKLLELALDLGDLNGAERYAYELLEKQESNLHALGAIIRIHVAKGQHEAARVVLGAAKRQVGWTHYLGQWHSMMESPHQLAEHPDVMALQGVKRTTNTLLAVSDEHTLVALQRDRPAHRLVLEYLLCYYLLEHQRSKFVRYLPELRSLGYGQLPRHYAEALLLYSLESKTALETFGWTVDSGIRRQFQQARATLARARSSEAAFATLAPQMGDSYTFYSVFNACGVK